MLLTGLRFLAPSHPYGLRVRAQAPACVEQSRARVMPAAFNADPPSGDDAWLAGADRMLDVSAQSSEHAGANAGCVIGELSGAVERCPDERRGQTTGGVGPRPIGRPRRGDDGAARHRRGVHLQPIAVLGAATEA